MCRAGSEVNLSLEGAGWPEGSGPSEVPGVEASDESESSCGRRQIQVSPQLGSQTRPEMRSPRQSTRFRHSCIEM